MYLSKGYPSCWGLLMRLHFIYKGSLRLCVIGMDSERLDPVYHTRLDVIENINPQALESMKKVLIKLLKT
jgi:hypothetical protein